MCAAGPFQLALLTNGPLKKAAATVQRSFLAPFMRRHLCTRSPLVSLPGLGSRLLPAADHQHVHHDPRGGRGYPPLPGGQVQVKPHPLHTVQFLKKERGFQNKQRINGKKSGYNFDRKILQIEQCALSRENVIVSRKLCRNQKRICVARDLISYNPYDPCEVISESTL